MTSRPKLLLVEQDEGLGRLLAHILRETHQVFIVDHTLEALRYLFSDSDLPEILIVDLNDQSIKEKELIQHINANGILRDIPIIALCTEQTESIATSIELETIIVKPFDPDELKQMILDLTIEKSK